MSSSSIRIRPPVAGSSLLISRIRVDLPAPEWPTMPNTSPVSMVILVGCSAGIARPPTWYDFCTWSNTIMVSALDKRLGRCVVGPQKTGDYSLFGDQTRITVQAGTVGSCPYTKSYLTVSAKLG